MMTEQDKAIAKKVERRAGLQSYISSTIYEATERDYRWLLFIGAGNMRHSIIMRGE